MSPRRAVSLAACAVLPVLNALLAPMAAHAATNDACLEPQDQRAMSTRLATALAEDPSKWHARPALDRWLNPPSYALPVRPDRYKLTVRDLDALAWLMRREGATGATGLARLVRGLLLPQIESVAWNASWACHKASPSVAPKLADLARAGLAFEIAVYRSPADAELIKRLQASRRKVFTLIQAAREGDAGALASVRALAGEAARDAMLGSAAPLYDAVERARAAAESAGDVAAAAALGPWVHTAEQARDATAQVEVAAGLQLLRGIAAAAPVVVQLLRDSAQASAREGARNEACGTDGASLTPGERAAIESCRGRWDQAHPATP